MVMNPYIRHSAKGTTWSKADAKYIKKIKVNGKWRYFYGSKELNEWAKANPEKGEEVVEDGHGNKVAITSAKRAGVKPGTYSWSPSEKSAAARAMGADTTAHDSFNRRRLGDGLRWTATSGNTGLIATAKKYTSVDSTYVDSLPKNVQRALYLGVTNSAVGSKRKDRGH